MTCVTNFLKSPWMRRNVWWLIFIFLLAGSLPLFATDWYVRPAGGNYGSANGTSYANAWNGLLNVVWGSGGVQAGDTLWVCGLHIHTMTTASNVATQANIYVASGTSDSSRVTLRGDYPADPGIVWGAFRLNHQPWVSEGNNTWSITLPGSSYPDWYFQDVSSGSWVVLDKAASLAECQGKPGSHYSSSYNTGGKLYVHCSDNGNPAGRILCPSFGYRFRVDNRSFVTFLNLKMYCMPSFIDVFGGQQAQHIRWEGCTLAYGEHSLLPFGDGCHYMEVIRCDLSWAGNGIYNISNTNISPSYYLYRGNTIHDIGVRPETQNSDAHAIGIQGGMGGVVEDNTCYNCGSGVTLYAFAAQDLKNTIVRRNTVYNTHKLGGANSFGIETSCDNDSLSDKSGNIFSQNVIFNAETGLKLQFEDLQEVNNNVIVNCQTGIHGARSYSSYGPNIKARNNIICGSGTYHIYFGTSGTTAAADFDDNLYYPDGPKKFCFNSKELDYAGWRSQVKSGFTFDPHSKVVDPMFVNAAGGNFHLQPLSPAIDAGTPVGLTQDKDGTTIPQGFAPDIGAYEATKPIFVSASASPTIGKPPLLVNFAGDAMGDSPPFTFGWDFGDGGTSSQTNPTHTYNSQGIFSATLTVTDSQGNWESKSVQVNTKNSRQLSVSVVTGAPAPGQGGTTNPPAGDHTYDDGSSVIISAVNNIGYRFSRWTGDVGTSSVYQAKTTILMDSDKSVAANFCTACGDVNGDLAITPADAQLAFDIYLGRISNPTACQRENADVNCDGSRGSPKVTPADCQAIFDKYLGKNGLPCSCSGASRAASLQGLRSTKSPTGIIGIQDTFISIGSEVSVPIMVESPMPLTAMGADISYPSGILEFVGFDKTGFSKDFIQFDVFQVAPGVLRIGGYRSSLIKESVSGTAAVVEMATSLPKK
jgi:PKD repeat protein